MNKINRMEREEEWQGNLLRSASFEGQEAEEKKNTVSFTTLTCNDFNDFNGMPHLVVL